MKFGAIRTALIGYGTAAFGYLFARHGLPADAKALGGGGSVSTFVLSGLGVQILLIVLRVLVERTVSDRGNAAQALLILELIGDGVTVLLFALATLGAIAYAPEEIAQLLPLAHDE